MSTRANVLLVDDKPENLLALETVLADLDQNLIRATSGREALKFLLLEDVALILLDVEMPGLNGFELAELIRERERTQHTPIIFVTAHADRDEYKFRGYSLGAVDYLAKPIDTDTLKSKVRFFSKLFLQQQEIRKQAKALEEANSRLDALNVELEERVRIRTAQLEKANRELENEIAVRRESELRLATEHAITRTLAAAGSISEAISSTLRIFAKDMNAAAALMWQHSAETGALQFSKAEVAAKETVSTSSFISESQRCIFKNGTGFPGHVWAAGSPVWKSNDAHGEQSHRAVVAASAGLNSAIGFPIMTGEQLYGVVELYSRAPLHSGPELASMFEAIGSEIGQFIQKKHAEDEREKLLTREKALREEAEAANRLKDEFLATVSHELRTPLNSILGWSRIVLDEKVQGEAVHSALETINRNARSQAQLIEDLLDASRLITGKLVLDLGPTDIVAIIEAAIDVVHPAAEAKGLTIETSYTSRVPNITCDATRLQQMVWNLLTNAVKFTPKEGKISVCFEDVRGWVRIVVADTGAGISPDFLPYVFDRFRQQDSSSTRRHEGLGLGLAIVRHLAELHGGTASVESQGPGKGSTFVISLPASEVSSADQPRDAEPTSQPADPATNGNTLTGVRILVVDDDDDACDMLRFALALQGASVEASKSVREAMEVFSQRPPDVVLADINMPGEDGYTLIKKIRDLRDSRAASVPAIAVTAMARPEDTDRAFAAGFQMHLPKPIEIDELSKSIAMLVNKAA